LQDLNDLHYFTQVVRHGASQPRRARPASPSRSSANGWLNSSGIWASASSSARIALPQPRRDLLRPLHVPGERIADSRDVPGRVQLSAHADELIEQRFAACPVRV
jgi:hypothetical protein